MLRKIAVVFAVVAAVALVPAPAQAHGQLAFSDPADKSTVTEPMVDVRLHFTEKPATNAFFSITAPDGTRVDRGWFGGEPKPLPTPVQELNLVNGNWEPQVYTVGFPTVIPVGYWPQTGVYTITYKSVASDGDRVSGEIRFDYQGRITQAPADWQAPTNQPDPALDEHGPGPGSVATFTATSPDAPLGPTSTTWPDWALGALIAVLAGLGVLQHQRRTTR